jgi:ABC-type multidrug transport system ATPase subunit
LRGIDKDNIEGSVDWILSELDLEKYRDIPAEQYSGGYKRKLSTAIALTG